MHSVCDPSEQDTIPSVYFVFLNEDSDQESTTVDYKLNVGPVSVPGYNIIFMISSIAMIAIVVMIKKYKN
ncbi:MAG: Loki-CTERM sorting domain-containing protein [Promethearchaeati archaeon]